VAASLIGRPSAQHRTGGDRWGQVDTSRGGDVIGEALQEAGQFVGVDRHHGVWWRRRTGIEPARGLATPQRF
jgi:hypothetical protein